ncbi:ESS family glutamate:Na+ symporter [Sedimentibacter acidaminivorans]|uniref:Sodium/glutamate symporter n=1 Tax=Sedimentibacter acidaminivorans TaxID=913099 RepID=A0ABS4GA01_9FIRM|nr:sodium/glutamate symporter [Sedimentibacter acidaminivorans]MBP1924515.1 ESS family glutamate:Na+ symporter [Sedimentibacter acidaminivorans]
MMLKLDMVQSIALSVIVLLLGIFLVKRFSILRKYCIPTPVVGGLVYALLALILKQGNILEVELDTTLQKIVMTVFFTSVGFSASFRILKKGGLKVAIFLACSLVLVAFQNIIGVLLSNLFNLSPLIGLATGSVPMTGGHGTAAAFGPLMEKAGALGANTVALAAATFGLISGSMIGGPVGNRLILKHDLLNKKKAKKNNFSELEELSDEQKPLIENNFNIAIFEILIAMGVGTLLSSLFEKAGLTLPSYIGAMLSGAIIRNISDWKKSYEVPMTEIDLVGRISLSLFLSMALMGLKLWQLADLALPLFVMLASQVLFMYLFANFVTFNLLGKDYDAAVLAAGHCGFGLGATPNGIANMTSVTEKFGPSPTAFFVLPLVGSLFIDFFNAGIVTFFMNLFV